MTDTGEDYILGADSDESRRLRFQHKVWLEHGHALFRRAGFRAGDRLLDLGCGPGWTSFELAEIVGPNGRVVARDQSPQFLETLQAEARHLGLDNIECSRGPVEDLDLVPGELDGAYARWLFCWLTDPGAVLARVARGLREGAVLALQEYFDWAAMKLVPRCRIFDRAVAACMQSWQLGGGTIDIAQEIPRLAEASGLSVDHFAPVARLGPVGSGEWNWIEQFFHSYLPKVVEAGLLSAEEFEEFRGEWNRRTESGEGYCYTPTMADVLLRNTGRS